MATLRVTLVTPCWERSRSGHEKRPTQKERFAPADVLDVHFDTMNPARREIVRLGLHLRDTRQCELSEAATKALAVLEKWFKAGASSDLKADGAELATHI